MLKRILIVFSIMIGVSTFSQTDTLQTAIWEKSVETEYSNRPVNFKQSVHLADSLYEVYDEKAFYFKTEKENVNSDGIVLILNLYQKGLGYRGTSSYCKKKIKHIKEIIRLMTMEELEKQFNKVVNKANEYYSQKNFVRAKEYFVRALTLKPSNEYAKQRLLEIDKILKSYE